MDVELRQLGRYAAIYLLSALCLARSLSCSLSSLGQNSPHQKLKEKRAILVHILEVSALACWLVQGRSCMIGGPGQWTSAQVMETRNQRVKGGFQQGKTFSQSIVCVSCLSSHPVSEQQVSCGAPYPNHLPKLHLGDSEALERHLDIIQDSQREMYMWHALRFMEHRFK